MNFTDLTPASGVEIHAAEMHGNDAAILPDADPSAMPSALMRDAGRYRWLRSRDLDAIRDGGVFAGQTPQNVVLNGVDLDHAIDAAMGLDTPTKAQTTAEIAADLRGKLSDIACLPAGADVAVAVLWARQAITLVDGLQSPPAVASPQPVAVKPLVWVAVNSWRWEAGDYRICDARRNQLYQGFIWNRAAQGWDGPFDTLELAQAAVQADYETMTIHPADPLSDPRVVAMVEAAYGTLAAIDRYNANNGTHIIGGPPMRLAKALAALRAIGGDA